MTETLLALVPLYGPWLIGLGTFLSCLALPIPSSLLMLTGGAFIAAGDLTWIEVAGAAFVGAVLGDQVGLWIGRRGGSFLARGKAGDIITKAQELMDRWGGPGVFLSRWLFSPLGPYVNFASGAARMNWARFTVWGAAGEAVWVSVYVGLGSLFGDNIQAVADIAGNFSGVLAAGAVTLGLGLWLRGVLRGERAKAAG